MASLSPHSSRFRLAVLLIMLLVCLVAGLASLAPQVFPFLTLVPWLWIFTTVGLVAWLTTEIGWLKAGTIAVALAGVGATIELGGVATGWPFGFYRYQSGLGPQILGLVPWAMLAYWSGILMSCYFMTGYITQRWWRALVSASLLTLLDLILDPVATKLGMWHWLNSSWYYQVPELNFLGGWLLYLPLFGVMSGVIRVGKSPVTYDIGSFFWLTLVFWSCVAFAQQLWGPGLIGLSASLWLLTFLNKPADQLAASSQMVAVSTSPTKPEFGYRQRKKITTK